jgi:tetratricopeptide (TPR) repeat protein
MKRALLSLAVLPCCLGVAGAQNQAGITSEIRVPDTNAAPANSSATINTPPAPSATSTNAPAPENNSDPVSAVLDRATKAIQSPKTTAADLDPILADIDAATTYTRTHRDEGYPQNYVEMQGARRYVQAWQSYLTDKSTNDNRAENDLRMLANIEGSFNPIPRSELLQRELKASGQSAASLGDIQLDSLDDIPAALQSLQAMQRNGNYTMEMNNLQSSLQQLNSSYQQYQDGNLLSALQQLVGGFGYMGGGMRTQATSADASGAKALGEKIATLKNGLLFKITQTMLAFPDLPTPGKDEKLIDYLTALAKSKAEAQDWIALQHVLEIEQQTSMGMPAPALQDDLAGIRAYLLGNKLEAAGQHLDAIRSYRQSLDTLGIYFPANPPREKLDELAKKYPDDYKEALQLPISPRTPGL